MDAHGRRPGSADAPEDGRATFEEVSEAPHAVIAAVADPEEARVVVENLQNSGVPANAIELVGADTKDPPRPETERPIADSDAFSSLSKSVIVGGVLGLLAGALLGLLLSYLIPPLGPVWGMVLGGVFGVAAGGAAGGMSVAKSGSPVWHETHQVEEDQGLEVAVHHASAEVVDKAEEIMSSHLAADRIRRLG